MSANNAQRPSTGAGTATLGGGGGGGARIAATKKVLRSLDGSRFEPPANCAESTDWPTLPAVTVQLATPLALVVPLHVAPPTVNTTVCPASAAIGFVEASTSEAVNVTAWPVVAPSGLAFKLTNVVCGPAPQVIFAVFEVNVELPTVADATTLSVPALTPDCVKLATPLASVRTSLA